MSDRPFLRLVRIWRDFVTQLQINANEEASNSVIECFYLLHSSVFHGLLPWPIMKSAGFPWTLYKVKIGIFLMKEMKRSQHLLNNTVSSYLDEKKSKLNQQVKDAEVAEEIPEKVDGEPCTVIEELAQTIETVDLEPENANDIDNDDDSNWTDISSRKEDDLDEELRLFAALPFSCNCTFNALKIDLANDEIAIDHLQKMNFGCECIFHGDLHSITTNYQAILESYIYIAKAIQMDETAEQITQILAEIPEKLAQFPAQPI